jgi:hypothetical protein
VRVDRAAHLPSQRATFVALTVFVWAFASSEAGCALVVGDVVGDAVLDPGVADGSAHHDATMSVEASADAEPEAEALGVDSPTDASTGDSAMDAAVDSPSDATADDARADADAAGSDVGFCAKYVAPDGATVYCNDFDESGDPTLFSNMTASEVVAPSAAGSTVTVQPGIGLSAPNAVVINAATGDASPAQSYLQLQPLAHGTTYTLQLDAKVTSPGDGTGANQFSGLFFGDSSLAILVVGSPGPSGAALTGFALAENVSSKSYYHVHPTIPTTNAGWVRLKLVISPKPGGGFVDNFWVDGVQSLADTDYPLNASFSLTTPGGIVGWQYVTGAIPRAAILDNVVLTVQ